MSDTLKLKNKRFCDGCKLLKDLNTLGRHRKCEKYGTIMLPQDDVFLAYGGQGHFLRPEQCKEEHDAVQTSQKA